MKMEKSQLTGLIFIDLKNVFDTVDCAILFGKLQKYDNKELERDWFKSYLANRRQFCKVNGVSAKMSGRNFLWCSSRVLPWSAFS